MKATISVYYNHEDALAAVRELKKEGYPVKHLSILGFSGTEQLDDNMHITAHGELTTQGVATGMTLGAMVGILTGVGMFVIPGLGFLYGAGAFIGALAGADLGLVGGGLATAFVNYGLHEQIADKYEKELLEGKYLLIANGSQSEVETATRILRESGTYSSLETYPTNAAWQSSAPSAHESKR